MGSWDENLGSLSNRALTALPTASAFISFTRESIAASFADSHLRARPVSEASAGWKEAELAATWDS